MIASFLAALLTVSAPSAPPVPTALPVAVADEAQDTEAALYKAGRASIANGDWQNAEQAFTKVVALKGQRADEALYWRAYAYNKMSISFKNGKFGSVGRLNGQNYAVTWQI